MELEFELKIGMSNKSFGMPGIAKTTVNNVHDMKRAIFEWRARMRRHGFIIAENVEKVGRRLFWHVGC